MCRARETEEMAAKRCDDQQNHQNGKRHTRSELKNINKWKVFLACNRLHARSREPHDYFNPEGTPKGRDIRKKKPYRNANSSVENWRPRRRCCRTQNSNAQSNFNFTVTAVWRLLLPVSSPSTRRAKAVGLAAARPPSCAHALSSLLLLPQGKHVVHLGELGKTDARKKSPARPAAISLIFKTFCFIFLLCRTKEF